MPRLSVLLYVEALMAVLSACALALTLVWPRWIEDVFGLEPDGGDGSTEWGLALVLLGITLTASIGAVRDWRLQRPGPRLNCGSRPVD